MSDPTIFNENPTAAPSASQAANPTQNDPNVNLLSMILNEQGQQKYTNVTEALKGAAHAQTYISELKRQLAEAQAAADAAKTSAEKQAELERTVQELLAKQNQNTPSNPSEILDPAKLAELVEQTLDRRTAAQKAKDNQSHVASELVKVFGEKAEEKYNEAAKELGLSVAEMNDMAAKSPKAVLKALGVAAQVAQKPQSFAPVSSAVNTAGFQPHQDTFVKRNATPLGVGATTGELQDEAARAKRMVEELHAAGGQVGDLADPKVFFKYFK